MASEPIHAEREGGIFIPYDKLLQQQSDKLDKILDELREFDRRKLDVAVFESFRSSYEQRHEALKESIAHTDRGLIGRTELVEEFHQAQRDIAALKTDKAGRDAVHDQNRYYLAGGGLVGLLVVVNLIINFLQIAHGHGP